VKLTTVEVVLTIEILFQEIYSKKN